MTTARQIMDRAKLQAAAEKAWREATHLHVASAWKHERERRLFLRALLPSVVMFDPDAATEPTMNPIVYCQAEMTVLGVRIMMTAPNIDREWFWIACRFHWQHGLESNYTS